MALRNITNNNKNFLFKKKQAPKMKENELIKIESLTCSPSSKKKISSFQDITKNAEYSVLTGVRNSQTTFH